MTRTVIVTGGNRGIGNAVAVAFAEADYDVGLTWHEDKEGAARTVEEVEEAGRRAVARRLQLENPADGVAATVQALADDLGGLDVFVANAGTGHAAPFLEHDLDSWQHVVDVDLTGQFVVMQAAARRMVEQGRGGRIVAVTSVHEHVPLARSAAYTAAKHGLGGLVKVAALELVEHGITVNAVAPGEIATRMTGAEDEQPDSIERPGIPAGRPGHAEEIAHFVVALAAPAASYATGASFVVDGGMLLMAAQANQTLA